MSTPSTPIAIIGAGLSGLTLALALHRHSIPCTLYESRPASLDIGGAIMLSPNALKVLDALGVYRRISPLGFHFEKLYFRSHDDAPLDDFDFGSRDKHGYKALRIYRYELINVLVSMVRDAGIPVEYNKKFSHVTAETPESVTWAFADGSSATARLLVGADGIHSRVRKHLYPDLTPKFTNMIGVTATVPRAQLQAGPEYPLPVTIMSPKHGAFVIAPQRADGSEVLIGKQKRLAQDYDRAGWDELMENKSWCVDFLRQGSEDFPPIVANAVSDIPLKGINLWPFYLVPKLDTWTKGRVVILGDAAHAIPPTAGQGVNQAFEDVYTFAGVVAKGREEGQPLEAEGDAVRMGRTLKKWQLGRQDRVDKVLELNDKLNKRRLPDAGGAGDLEPFDLDWLYGVDFEDLIAEWAS
ncbi:FAD/NAD(P)-binding domain-containing protein [Trichoderma citrinoviride]|uniref:FAD/NAD(P)-binding domain-containing protein n=1 Tax=Trichoderma citrinoviride TaxID=58853 RepID=A0A2T4AYT3_9HYPO|nr:FAD/NAD(P)-binding domain-containing protein [Trichoderma citrinoviride]PTB62224.1 FAD/NAD(P)-binding domain-containing protein [Trichoderma citrinoviride]